MDLLQQRSVSDQLSSSVSDRLDDRQFTGNDSSSLLDRDDRESSFGTSVDQPNLVDQPNSDSGGESPHRDDMRLASESVDSTSDRSS